MIRFLLSCSLLALGAVGQSFATVPNVTSFQNVDRPFPGGIGRYQQWYSASSLQADLPDPMRFEKVEFFAGTSQTSNATLIDCEILIGHGYGFGVTGTFDNNFAETPLVVAPRANRQLQAGAPGAVVMSIPFVTLFTWDHQRPIVLEIRVYGNGFANQPFLYNFQGTTIAVGQTTRVYQTGSAGAPTGTTQQGWGMNTRFTARPGAVVDFGSGCAGAFGIVPKNTVVQVPSPGIVWTHQLSQAAPQQVALWVIGDDNSAAIDFLQLLGGPASGCMLRTNVLAAGFYITVGGSAGTGFASFDWQLAPVTSYVGLSFYTQWFCLDQGSPNGVLSTTQGVHSIVAPVGG